MKKALKTYIRLGFSPVMAVFGLALSAALIVALGKDPAARGTDDYAEMLSAANFGHVGIMLIAILAPFRMCSSKVFMSYPFAKELFTSVPVLFTAVTGIIYDAAAFIVALICWKEPVYDLAAINAFGTVLSSFVIGSMGKKYKGSTELFLLAYALLFASGLFLPAFSFIKNGMIPDTAAGAGICAAVTAAIYIIGIGGVLYFIKRWWNSADRGPGQLSIRTVTLQSGTG